MITTKWSKAMPVSCLREMENARAHGLLSRRHKLVIITAMILCVGACSDDDKSPVAPGPVDAPGTLSHHRLSWSLASLPVDPAAGGDTPRTFTANDRVETIRWFLLNSPVLRRYLEPDVGQEEGEAPVPALELYLRSETGAWETSNWGGIMCSPTATGTGFPDMSGMAWLDIWVNDGIVDPTQRTGRLHVDFGRLDEDGYWPLDPEGQLVTNQFEQEDGILGGEPDGVWGYHEDIGLDGCVSESCVYSADYGWYSDPPYPQINNMARNNREDTEDIDHNGEWDRTNSYFTHVIDLAATVPIIDVVQDYDNVQELVDAGIAWRLYRIPIRRELTIVNASGEPDLADVRHFRIWLEDASNSGMPTRRVQLAGIRFH
ncbi:MAG: hypothetical protein IPP62_10030 [bacterium]|nr:hypothetical protein [bacterium]